MKEIMLWYLEDIDPDFELSYQLFYILVVINLYHFLFRIL